MQNDQFINEQNTSDVNQPDNTALEPVAPVIHPIDQSGVSVFPSLVENHSQPVSQLASTESLAQNIQVNQINQEPQLGQTDSSTSLESGNYNLNSNPPTPNQQPVTTSSVSNPVQDLPSSATLATVQDAQAKSPKIKNLKNWIILIGFIILASLVTGYFYFTTEQTLNNATVAANNFSAGIKYPYSGIFVSSGQKAFQVFVPNGSDLVIDPQGDMIVFHKLGEGKDEPIKQGYVDGVGGGDRPTLSIWTQKKTNTVAIAGVKPTTPFYADGVQAKYYQRTYQPSDAIGTTKAEGGEKVYRYVFEYDEKQTIIDYFIKRKDIDQSEQVAKMAASLKFKQSRAITTPPISN
ncbi:hypothetical protein EOL73_00435 [Candidatus Saccharibacteria bacterium]|nr:hypothetical protein [Candidatus Saccharibacteria bacterium]NCU40209.1 hypothetical protein [Candidatus Saccharibacteria bacterium]